MFVILFAGLRLNVSRSGLKQVNVTDSDERVAMLTRPFETNLDRVPS